MTQEQPSMYQAASSDTIKLMSYKHLIKNIKLRNKYKEWLNNKKNIALIGSRELNEKIYTNKDIELAFERFSSSTCHGFFLYCVKLEIYIGTVKIDKIDWCRGTAEDGILIGESRCHGQGYGTNAYKVLLDYAFNMLELKIIRGGCNEQNYSMRKIFEKLGYKKTHVAKKTDFVDNQWSNHVFYELKKENLRIV